MGYPLPVPVMLCLATILTSASVRAEDAVAPPRNPGLTERVESRLVQFEVRVSRKGAPVHGLAASDFDIEVGGKPLKAFTVDAMCGDATASSSGTPATRPGSFIFYFDGPELTPEGRRRAIEVARLVAPALLTRGHEVLILENGTSLRVHTKWTHDAAEVSAALDRIASDAGNGDSLRAAAEELHAERLMERFADAVRESEMEIEIAVREAQRLDRQANAARAGRKFGGGMVVTPAPPPKVHDVREGQNEVFAKVAAEAAGEAVLAQHLGEVATLVQGELRRIERDIQRLRGTVRFLALRESPKGVVYFADTLRRDPGGVAVRALESASHFTRYLNDPEWHRRRATVAPSDANTEMLALIRDASTYGVRFYAVEGRGLPAASDWVRTSQDTLASLALETGGLSFLNGLAPTRVADRVIADQSCWYLVSFEPSGWDEDRTLALGVWPKQPGVRVETRSALVIPSRATLTQTRLVAAHFGDPALGDRPLSVSVYPVGGTTKRLQVLAQVRLPDGDVPNARDTTWDVGFEVVSRGKVVAHDSSRVTWHGGGQPPIYQTTLSLPAGPYEIVAVAREDATDTVRAGRVNGTWPSSPADRVTLSLPAIAQPQRGGIVLDGKAKASGIVVRGAGNPVDPRGSVAIVTAACVERSTDAVFRAERRIVGQTEVSFAPMELRPDEDRCVQIRDLVAAGSLGAGRLTYFVSILSGDDAIASQQLLFDVADVSAPSQEVIAPPAK